MARATRSSQSSAATAGSGLASALHSATLAKAIEGARAKAKKTAEQFGARLGSVYSISEKSMDYDMAQEIAMNLCQGMPAGRVGTFEPGMMQISAEVHAVFRIKPGK